MARSDKAERARRQGLARDRRAQEEILEDRMLAGQETEQIRLAEIAEAEWETRRAAEQEALDQARYAENAVKALDELARLWAEAEQADAGIEPSEIREILVSAGHPDFLPDSGWCGTGL